MRWTKVRYYILISITLMLTMGCEEKKSSSSTSSTPASSPVTSSSRYLYVAAGQCYSGNNTTFTNLTASNQVYRININTGQKDMVLADYWANPANPGDSPTGIASVDANNLLVLVENSTATMRRIEKVQNTNYGSRSTFSNNTTALNNKLRYMSLLPNLDLLISKSIALEYFTSSNIRIGAPYISASAAPCNTSTTLISKNILLSNNKTVFLHAAASQNRVGIFSGSGTTCQSVQAAPTVNSYPTAVIYDSTNNILMVAYSGNSTAVDINSIYTYSIDETTGAFSNPQKIYDANLFPSTYSYLLYGVSEMAYDSTNSEIFISTAISNTTTVANYSIERFKYDPTQIGVDNTKVLTRYSGSSFYPYGIDTKCISQMFVQ